jgi:hypothetical protein
MDIPILERDSRIREYEKYPFQEISRLVKHWLLIGDLGHRELEREILSLDPVYWRGFQSMGILHYLGLKQPFKGIFRGHEVPFVVGELQKNHQDFAEIIRYLEAEDLDFTVGQTLITQGQTNDRNFKRRFNKHLDHLTHTDGQIGNGNYRREQSALRALLFEESSESRCAMCLKILPVELMVAAHIKPRSKCSESERLDPNVVMPMCKIGCDALYENNYLIVDKSGAVIRPKNTLVSEDLKVILNGLEGNVCPYFNDQTKDYFSYKRQNIKQPS